MCLSEKPQYLLLGVFNLKFLTCLSLGIQNPSLYFISVFDARIVLCEVYHGVSQIVFP